MAASDKTVKAAASRSAIPSVGDEWFGLPGSVYAGISTNSEGRPYALVKVATAPKRASHAEQMAWAKSIDADLMSPAEALLALVTIPDHFPKEWGWTNKLEGSSYAWYCNFYFGYFYYYARSSEGAAVAVRRFFLDSFDFFCDLKARASQSSAQLRSIASQIVAACDAVDAATSDEVTA